MNTKIIDYKLVTYGGSLEYGVNIQSELEEKVKYQISQGWEPLGGVAGSGGFCRDQEYTWLHQAMVKRAA